MAFTLWELAHLLIPLEDIVKATNNFSDENIIGKGDLGNVYKGELLHKRKLINVSVRRINCKQDRKNEFLTEISMLYSCRYQHLHVVSMIGYCEERGEKIIVYHYQANQGSLVMHLTDTASFTWLQRIKLSIQVAEAIRYLHAERSFKMQQDKKSLKARHLDLIQHYDFDGEMQQKNNFIIHRNINSFTILLDENMIPRLSGFEYSIQQSVNRKDHIQICEAIGTRGYMDPAMIEHGGVIYKSDVYAFGVVLFEILCGKKAYQDNKSLVKLAKYHYEHETLQKIIPHDLWEQMDPNSFKYFSKAAYSCLETEWTQRPNIHQVLDKLEKALTLDHVEPVVNLKDVKSASPNYKKALENKTATWEEQLKRCIDNANELISLHNEMDAQNMLIHDDTNSGNIALHDNNLGTKIVGYRDSVFHNEVYIDPEFLETRMLCKESDVFGFGVHIFEMLCGYEVRRVLKLVGHKNEGMRTMIRTWFSERKGSIDGVLLGGKGDSKLFINKGLSEDSLSILLNIVCACVETKRNERPPMKVVVHELHRALTFQKNYKDNFRMSYEDIKLATQSFSLAIGSGGFGKVYKGKLAYNNGKGYYPIVAKKLDTRQDQGHKEFYNELQVLCEYKHKNIIGLIGYSDETKEKIIVYEYASKGSLDKYLKDVTLTWKNRLKICIDFATGLDFLHEREHAVIHRDIKSSNILLFNDWKTKIGDFGLSMISATNSYIIDHVCGTPGYVDPLYSVCHLLTKESDIYSFGVVLFEILCGKTIYEILGYKTLSLVSFIQDNFDNRFDNRIEDDLWFKAIKEEIVPSSLATFLKIVFYCLHHEREKRPTAKLVLEQLKKALNIQVHASNLRMSLDDIKFVTQNFSLENQIKRGNFGSVYKGEFTNKDGKPVVAKKFDTSIGQGKQLYYNEFQIVYEYKHKNIIRLLGYINEMDEKILVYEHASKGSLDKYLNDASLTWTNRLKICLNFAIGLNFLHEGVDGKEVVIHKNIQSSNILLFDNWKAKVGGFSLSRKISTNRYRSMDLAWSTSRGYMDPIYPKSGMITIESDIYSFGVVLFEILCGKVVYEIHKHESESLLRFIKNQFEKGKRDDVVFKDIKKEVVPESVATFLEVVYQCLDDDPKKRPSSREVVKQLEWALSEQETGCLYHNKKPATQSLGRSNKWWR